ncbi:MAG TPA: hypothetical protein VL131_17110 [Gammaproteobacteria bacterium]|nr:hypothetical protein [Gammaproteobacteria bacterium]
MGYLIGLLLSAVFDLPTGAVIVWTLAAVVLASGPLLRRWRDTGATERATPY